MSKVLENAEDYPKDGELSKSISSFKKAGQAVVDCGSGVLGIANLIVVGGQLYWLVARTVGGLDTFVTFTEPVVSLADLAIKGGANLLGTKGFNLTESLGPFVGLAHDTARFADENKGALFSGSMAGCQLYPALQSLAGDKVDIDGYDADKEITKSIRDSLQAIPNMLNASDSNHDFFKKMVEARVSGKIQKLLDSKEEKIIADGDDSLKERIVASVLKKVVEASENTRGYALYEFEAQVKDQQKQTKPSLAKTFYEKAKYAVAESPIIKTAVNGAKVIGGLATATYYLGSAVGKLGYSCYSKCKRKVNREELRTYEEEKQPLLSAEEEHVYLDLQPATSGKVYPGAIDDLKHCGSALKDGSISAAKCTFYLAQSGVALYYGIDAYFYFTGVVGTMHTAATFVQPALSLTDVAKRWIWGCKSKTVTEQASPYIKLINGTYYFLADHKNSVFAASVASAPVTMAIGDFISYDPSKEHKLKVETDHKILAALKNIDVVPFNTATLNKLIDEFVDEEIKLILESRDNSEKLTQEQENHAEQKEHDDLVAITIEDEKSYEIVPEIKKPDLDYKAIAANAAKQYSESKAEYNETTSWGSWLYGKASTAIKQVPVVNTVTAGAKAVGYTAKGVYFLCSSVIGAGCGLFNKDHAETLEKEHNTKTHELNL